MRKHIFAVGIYLSVAALLSACAQSFQETSAKRVGRGGAKSGADVSQVRNSDSSVTVSFNGIKLEVSSSDVFDGAMDPTCNARKAAMAESATMMTDTAKYFVIKVNSQVVLNSNASGMMNMDTCAATRNANGSVEYFEGVANNSENSAYYTTLFTRCGNESCTEAYGVMKIVATNYKGQGDEYRECGFQILAGDNYLSIDCLDKGASYGSNASLGVQCSFSPEDPQCAQLMRVSN